MLKQITRIKDVALVKRTEPFQKPEYFNKSFKSFDLLPFILNTFKSYNLIKNLLLLFCIIVAQCSILVVPPFRRDQTNAIRNRSSFLVFIQVEVGRISM